MGSKLPTNSNDAKHATSLSRLKHGQCRWIISERPQKLLFCGAPASAEVGARSTRVCLSAAQRGPLYPLTVKR